MPSTSPFYRGLIRLGALAAPALARARPKLARGLAAREGLLDRYRAWSAAHRDPARPLLWMHAPSVGEGLQAQVVLDTLRSRHPAWQIVYTHFSPSAEALARSQPADFADYLPWDRPADVETALDLLSPTALVFCKLDLWPELATRAAARGVAVGLIAATVSRVSGRSRWPARALLRAGYGVVRRAGAIADGDADRLHHLGVPRDRIQVTGDPRFDSSLHRVQAIHRDDPLLRWCDGAATLVAGSTWAEDEERLCVAYGAVRAARSDVRLIVVPHEPTEEHLARLDAMAATHRLQPPVRLSQASAPAPFMVADTVGGLARLYVRARIAYVGGGFGDAGLHSVLEPAACGIPVLFGPKWQGSRDAEVLLTHRAAIEVSENFPDWLDLDRTSTYAGASPLAAIWLALLRNPGHAGAAGRRALECVQAGLGAAARNAALVEELMTEQPATR